MISCVRHAASEGHRVGRPVIDVMLLQAPDVSRPGALLSRKDSQRVRGDSSIMGPERSNQAHGPPAATPPLLRPTTSMHGEWLILAPAERQPQRRS